MPRITLSFTNLQFDAASYKKALHDTLEKEIRMAARAWLRAVIPRVPVYTGTARGSLQPLGRFLRVAVPISPVAKRKNMGPSVGSREQDFKFTSENGKYLFIFSSEVAHYKINEFYSVPLKLRNPTPWLSFEAGRQAFDQYLTTELPKKLPNASNFLRFGSVIRE